MERGGGLVALPPPWATTLSEGDGSAVSAACSAIALHYDSLWLPSVFWRRSAPLRASFFISVSFSTRKPTMSAAEAV